jgi:hypothetical protein
MAWNPGRIAGLLYLGLMTAPLRLVYIPNKLIVSGNASATAANIASHETLFRLGILSDLFTATMAIFLTLALYRLFRDVDRDLAALVFILGAVFVTPIYFVNTINDYGALLFARGTDFLSVIGGPERDAFVMLFLRLHQHGVRVNEVFWGLWLIPFGLVVYKSRFVPRFLGVWLIVNCFVYLATAFAGIMFPAYEARIWNTLSPLSLGEVAIMLWLLIKGAKPPARGLVVESAG